MPDDDSSRRRHRKISPRKKSSDTLTPLTLPVDADTASGTRPRKTRRKRMSSSTTPTTTLPPSSSFPSFPSSSSSMLATDHEESSRREGSESASPMTLVDPLRFSSPGHPRLDSSPGKGGFRFNFALDAESEERVSLSALDDEEHSDEMEMGDLYDSAAFDHDANRVEGEESSGPVLSFLLSSVPETRQPASSYSHTEMLMDSKTLSIPRKRIKTDQILSLSPSEWYRPRRSREQIDSEWNERKQHLFHAFQKARKLQRRKALAL